MAEQMQDIKRRIKSVGSTERITNAMKLVSASKLRKAKLAYEYSKTFMNKVFESISAALSEVENVPMDFVLGSREIKNTCYVLITSSNGLCGSFNATAIKACEEEMTAASGDKLVTIGTKGKDYFAHHGVEILMAHDEPADSITFDEAKKIAQYMVNLYKDGTVDEIVLIYTAYINTLKQEVTAQRVLPIEVDMGNNAADACPAKVSGSQTQGIKVVAGGSEIYHEVEYEPSAEAVFNYMIPKLVELKLYNAALESATCEHAARRTAMENANDNATDMLSALRVHYNRARQAEITDEIIEIVAGSEAQN